jgi:putative phosphoesterase
MKILLLSDIHANYPALQAVSDKFPTTSFDCICNCGDSLVYGPFPNETLHWLEDHKAYSILGNTDRKVIRLLKGKSFKKPRKTDKRIMYTWTAAQLCNRSRKYLLSLKKSHLIQIKPIPIFMFHGSPEHPDEFLFPATPLSRFKELADSYPNSIIITGHSHTPYYKHVGTTHFINPGSVGRMFDSNPTASCALLHLTESTVSVEHFRVEYPIQQITAALEAAALPEIYQQMYLLGQKLN